MTTVLISVVVLCGLTAAVAARFRSAAFRHWILTVTLGCAAAVPAFERVVPHAVLPVAPLASVTAPFASMDPSGGGARIVPGAAPGRAAAPSVLPIAYARIVWIAGSVLSLLVLFAGVGRLVWLRARARRVTSGAWARIASSIASERGYRRRIAILESTHPALLVTWGLRRPTILLPSGADRWPEQRIEIVLRHEIAHIERGDWLPQLLAEILRALFWFHPLLWVLSRRLRLESERACDDVVLRSGVAAVDYGAHLVAVAQALRYRGPGLPGSVAPAMARRNSLETRINAMLDNQLDRTPATLKGRCGVVALLITLTLALVGASQGQATFSGTIFDPSNAAVPAVNVVLTNAQTGAVHQVQSDRSGRFEISGLAPGQYTFEAKLMGFATLSGTVTVADRNVQRDLMLNLGSLRETITVATSRDAAPSSRVDVKEQVAPSVPSKPCTPSDVGGNIRPPLKIKDVRPLYPPAARDAGIGGTVLLDARIGTDGRVGDVAVRQASDPELAGAASEAVRQWRFTPTLLNCNPVEVVMSVSVTFDVR